MSSYLITAEEARQRKTRIAINKRYRLTKQDALLVKRALKIINNRIYYESQKTNEIYFNDYEFFHNAINLNTLLNNMLFELQKVGYTIEIVELVDYTQVIIRW